MATEFSPRNIRMSGTTIRPKEAILVILALALLVFSIMLFYKHWSKNYRELNTLPYYAYLYKVRRVLCKCKIHWGRAYQSLLFHTENLVKCKVSFSQKYFRDLNISSNKTSGKVLFKSLFMTFIGQLGTFFIEWFMVWVGWKSVSYFSSTLKKKFCILKYERALPFRRSQKFFSSGKLYGSIHSLLAKMPAKCCLWLLLYLITCHAKILSTLDTHKSQKPVHSIQ